MPLAKTDLEKLEIAPELKADIMALFGEIETKESALTAMRAKVPTDSQTVVSSVDHAKFLAATKELETMKQELAAKLTLESTPETSHVLSMFRGFFE